MANPLRDLPAIDELLRWPELVGVLATLPHRLAVAAVRREVATVREAARAGDPLPDRTVWVARLTTALTDAARPNLRRVVNGTGVVLHTNLGRAPLDPATLAAVVAVATGYSTLEYDVAAGRRGSRQAVVAELLVEVTGAEAACVVNNNAAAVLLMVDGVASGREVVVSRGELVEIGGSFRIPEVMAKGGATLVEAGATNRTHLADYQAATTEETAAWLKVHQSNFRQVGFTGQVPVAELATAAHARGLLCLEDLGSGCLVSPAELGLAPEPTVAEAVAAGVDLVSFSGDKLLGGPQAGIVVGRLALIDRLAGDPLARAVRCDKMTLASLELLLRTYLEVDGWRRIPTLAMLTAPVATLAGRARRLAARIRRAAPMLAVSCRRVDSRVGGGAQAEVALPSVAVVLRHPDRSATDLEGWLRTGEIPVIGRIENDELLLDCRCLLPGDGAVVCDRLRRLVGGLS